ncbi:MAG TPA: hypothetical protein PK156_38305, partial [Polyangium sp.]|nr:hypothetical protein [Polyangium sp.]
QVPSLGEIYAPETHAAALDPAAPIVVGARGTGKSFWAGVLGDSSLRAAAAKAYPRIRLADTEVQFGYTGLDGAGIGREKLDQCVSANADRNEARTFFWATILRALDCVEGKSPLKLPSYLRRAGDLDTREAEIAESNEAYQSQGKKLVIVYDALDTMAISWPRRRLLTLALLEVVWAMRAYRAIRVKLFLRPDQLDDDTLHFVELPKLRAGAVRLTWPSTDLYGLLFARLALGDARPSFGKLLEFLGYQNPSQNMVLTRRWSVIGDPGRQQAIMTRLAGPYMADGAYGYKKGKTYEWPLKHLGDAFNEVTPRSFLSLVIAAAQHGVVPPNRVMAPAGMHHGLRDASRTRVDQLHQEFPWIKGVLKPLAGLLLPQDEEHVFAVWRAAKTLNTAMADAAEEGYMPPVPTTPTKPAHERDLYKELERIGVMMRRKDDRIDMPDLFRVAARLLKKGGTAPLA